MTTMISKCSFGFLALLLITTTTAYDAINYMNPASNLYVNVNMESSSLNIDGPNATLTCNNIVAKTFICGDAQINDLELDSISASNIVSPDKQPIQIAGRVKVLGSISHSSSKALVNKKMIGASFIVTNDFIVNDVIQWKTIDHESFNHLSDTLFNDNAKDINGWSIQRTQPSIFDRTVTLKLSGNNDDKMIVGSYSEEVTKTFSDLPEHNELMIEAQFHFLSPFWRGQAAFLKVDGQLVWLDHHDWSEYPVVDPCTFDPEHIEDYEIKAPIHVVVKHFSHEAKIEIGTTKSSSDLSECESELFHNTHLFGFDDFVLNIK
jgi:hypothetical protein